MLPVIPFLQNKTIIKRIEDNLKAVQILYKYFFAKVFLYFKILVLKWK